jgi:hypothetical protein
MSEPKKDILIEIGESASSKQWKIWTEKRKENIF